MRRRIKKVRQPFMLLSSVFLYSSLQKLCTSGRKIEGISGEKPLLEGTAVAFL